MAPPFVGIVAQQGLGKLVNLPFDPDVRTFKKGTRIWTAAALFSAPHDDGRLPLSWDYDGYCDSRGFDSCRPDTRVSLTSMFRKWVGLLTSQDASDLRAFDLSLDELRASAKRGLWHGAIIHVSPKEGLALAGIPEIDVLALGDMIVAFDDGDAGQGQ